MTMSKITTKKILVAYDPSKPESGAGDFLVPFDDGTGLSLLGLRSRKRSLQGRMVYIGREITANDVFAKLIDGGSEKIGNVAKAIKAIEAYLEMLQEFRIGNILAVELTGEEACGFRFKKLADASPVKGVNLP